MGKLVSLVLVLCVLAGMGIHAMFVHMRNYALAYTCEELLYPPTIQGGEIVTDILMSGDTVRKKEKELATILEDYEEGKRRLQ